MNAKKIMQSGCSLRTTKYIAKIKQDRIKCPYYIETFNSKIICKCGYQDRVYETENKKKVKSHRWLYCGSKYTTCKIYKQFRGAVKEEVHKCLVYK